MNYAFLSDISIKHKRVSKQRQPMTLMLALHEPLIFKAFNFQFKYIL